MKIAAMNDIAMKYIAIIGTLDTKGSEVRFVRDQIAALGQTPVVIDPGILGAPTIFADVTRETIARAGGEELAALVARRDKAHAQKVMMAGLVKTLQELYAAGNLHGVIALGGAQGSALASAGMRALPFGVPKLLVSVIANGLTTFGPYVGTKDMLIMHSVADLQGLNRITYSVLGQAAAAIVGMVTAPVVEREPREAVAISQAGITTRGVVMVKDQLEKLGFEVICFHANGISTKAMEELVEQGEIQGVIEYSPHEPTDLLFNGLMPALPDRLRAPLQKGIPFVLTPGVSDVLLRGAPEELPPDLAQRKWVRHSPTHTHVRVNAQEMRAVAEWMAERINQGKGPRAVLIPLRGFSMLNRQGEPLYDYEANMGFVEGMERTLSREVELIKVDAHINDPEFAEATVKHFLRLRELAHH